MRMGARWVELGGDYIDWRLVNGGGNAYEFFIVDLRVRTKLYNLFTVSLQKSDCKVPVVLVLDFFAVGKAGPAAMGIMGAIRSAKNILCFYLMYRSGEKVCWRKRLWMSSLEVR